MPLFSLSGDGGIGDLGQSAYDFIDQLEELGANYWQILPLNLIDKAGCPYASPSAFGCEPLLIDTATIGVPYTEDFNHEIDYEGLKENKLQLLKEYAQEMLKKPEKRKNITAFQKQHPWVYDLAVFLSLSDAFGPHWSMWPQELNDIQNARDLAERQYQEDLEVNLYLQFTVHQQWQRLKEYAELKKIQIIGDIPIFVSADSFDAWRWPELFKINPKTGSPLVITGAPPDDFSEDGQLWGTLNYNWDHPELTKWWLNRLRYSQNLYHLTRIDHFVGLYHVWESAPDAVNARLGQYVPSRGRQLLQKIEEEFPTLPFIAEDLGVLNDNIRKLREDFNYPTMRVYQFSLEEKGKPQTAPSLNEHMPDNVPEHSFYYTGTHDNNTLRGWLDDVMENHEQLSQLQERFGKSVPKGKDFQHWPHYVLSKIIEDVLHSQARNVILPLQDIFSFAGESRINVPGTQGQNWKWRLSQSQWDESLWQEAKARLIRSKRGRHSNHS